MSSTPATTDAPASLKRTPLYARHVQLGAKLIDFGGWEMPVKYTSETEEHLAVRNGVGVFDVSHMGQVFIEGEGALEACQRLFTNDVAAIPDGKAMYTGMLDAGGGFIDDLIVYRASPRRFLVVLNASNIEKDVAHMQEVVAAEFAGRATVRDESPSWALLAVQGPKAVEVVSALCGEDARAIGAYAFRDGELRTAAGSVPCLIARTGYTGEDGFELAVQSDVAPAAWDAVLAAGAAFDLKPCGLAARDTLRLEAGLALYGNDIDDTHTPLEANLGWIVKLDAPRPRPFIGAEALRQQKATGVPRLLRGLEMIDRGIARHGYTVHGDAMPDGRPIGSVTSGTQAPYVQKAIAMAYLERPHDKPGAEVFVDVRGRKLRARVVKLPFYRRPSSTPL